MLNARTRREFLGNVGKGMLIATVGPALAADLGLAKADDGGGGDVDALSFGPLEKLVALLQETPIDRLNAVLVEKIRGGTDLRTLTAAAALANARTFGGEDYVGFHTMMALGPAYRMSRELPADLAPLPVMKVLYRNTNRIQEHGGRKDEVLHAVSGAEVSKAQLTGEALREAVRGKDVKQAERILAGIAASGGGADAAFNALLAVVADNTEVHRVVLPYRAWDMLELCGREQAHTLLRQSVRYCVRSESWPRSAAADRPRQVLPAMMEKYKLMEMTPGTKEADDAFLDKLSTAIFGGTPDSAAEAAASALADGFAPDVVGQAISLAANQLILRDVGRQARDEVSGKPMGSVHGDSIGVHACDSANAWRNMARVANARNAFACLILGAYQVALDRVARGGNFLAWEPLPLKQHLNGVKSQDAAALLGEAEDAIRGNLQARAAAVAHRYGELGHAHGPLFALLLKYAVSEDGSLHAEKFYRTASDEFANTRPAMRWRQAVALARVTASEFGRPAAGMAQARELLGV
jgi:hypothetical protein